MNGGRDSIVEATNKNRVNLQIEHSRREVNTVSGIFVS